MGAEMNAEMGAEMGAGTDAGTDAAAARAPDSDRREIRELIDAWPIWRDGGDWARLAAAWHPGGTMTSTRFSGNAEDFVAQTRAAHERGADVRHVQGGFSCEVRGDRAVTVTGMEIRQRGTVHGVEVDAACLGRFVDFLEYRTGRWGIVRRQPVYDRDRIDPVRPGEPLALDAELLAGFPGAYRHLAYLQHHRGQSINRDLPEGRGPAWQELLAETRRWLAGRPVRRLVIGRSDGVSVVQEPVPDRRSPVPGLTTTLVWATGRDPDHRPTTFDRPAGIAPPEGGSRFSVVELDPGYRAATLHRTDTVDYVICLDGPVDLLLDDRVARLDAGDVAVQCGANHGWHNPGAGVARLAVVLLDAHPKRAGSIAGASMAP